MRKIRNRFKQLIVASSIIVFVTACNPATKTQESIATPAAPPIATITFAPKITETPYPTDVPNHFEQSDNRGDGFIARVLITDTEGLNSQEILTRLLSIYLEHYKTESQDPDIAIKDYKDINVVKVIKDDNNYDGFFEIVAYVEFSIIHVGGLPGEGGIPINSGIHNDWVTLMIDSQGLDNLWWHIGSVFGYFRDGEYFRLRMMPGWGT